MSIIVSSQDSTVSSHLCCFCCSSYFYHPYLLAFSLNFNPLRKLFSETFLLSLFWWNTPIDTIWKELQTVKVARFLTFITSTSFLAQFLFMPTIFCKKTPEAGWNQRTNADLYRNIATLTRFDRQHQLTFRSNFHLLDLNLTKLSLHLRRFLKYELWLWAPAKL